MSGPSGGAIGPIPGAQLDLSNIDPISPVDFNNQRIVNVANPLGLQDVVTLDYFNNNPPSGVANVNLSNILPVASVDFNSQKLINVANPTNPQDVVTLDYFDNNPPSGLALLNLSNIVPVSALNFNSQRLGSVADPINPQDVVTLSYFGSNVAGGATRQLDNLLNTAMNANLFFANNTVRTFGTQDNLSGNANTMNIRVGAGISGAQANLDIRTRDSVSPTGPDTGQIFILTGSHVQGSGDLNTGKITIQTGQINNGGETGDVGGIDILGGSNLSVAPGSVTGPINIRSGSASGPNNSGNMTFVSGTAGPTGTSGSCTVGSSGTGSGNTGNVIIESGQAGNLSGTINIRTGLAGSGTSGSTSITTGNGLAGNSGNITLQTGTSTAVRGLINLNARAIDYNSSPNIDHVWQSGISASRPGPLLGKTYFDTTLNKPIWHNGTNWVDATGTIV